jgi:hypothetical protein
LKEPAGSPHVNSEKPTRQQQKPTTKRQHNTLTTTTTTRTMLQAKKPKANASQRWYAARKATRSNTILQLDMAVKDIIPKLTVLSQPGDGKTDYGQHMLTLNYSEEFKASQPKGVGSIRLGMGYDRDSKGLHENRARCLSSQ